ncbi:hypothetical protein WJX81_003247 [Elliptochloris bilobata]|uniref:Uncharacterized protein n=1 Tax=Elliptochloris bilobata TaxID=381761 RepID=A0AAW1SCP8_9CHLO
MPGAFVGAIAGFAVVLYSNGLRKVPLMREPWEHFIGAGIGAWLGNELVKYVERTEKEIEELLQRREAANKNYRIPSMAGK